jgi:hypothetical protein
MKALVFYQSTNRKGRHDATGAFVPEAEAFLDLHGHLGIVRVPIPHDTPRWRRRRIFESVCKEHGDGTFDAIVYFGHGTPRGLPGLGYRCGNDGHDRMADHAAMPLHEAGKVVLFACLAGKGFGFADRMALSLRFRDPKAEVIAHLTKGHTSWNPVAEYSGRGKGHAGLPIIGRRNALWKEWVRRLRDDQKFRLTFPFLTLTEINAQLRGDHHPPGPSKLVEERP